MTDFAPRQPERIEGDIPLDLPVADGGKFLFISRDQRALTHGLHKYPAKFFPELPRWIIQRYSNPGDRVLDPFMGSGTTNLEASLLGRHSVGVDVDPFSRLLARVKTTPLPEDKLRRAHATLLRAAECYSEPDDFEGVPEFPYRDNWFKPYILKELAYLDGNIKALRTSAAIRDFFRVCMSSTIRQVSEADNNCTRTVVRKKLGKVVKPRAAINLFTKRINTHVENMVALTERHPSGTVTIPNGADACHLKGIPDNSLDLALTSPPYVNAVDYPRTHQLEMYWLGLAHGSLQPLKRRHVGTEAVTTREYADYQRTDCAPADEAIAEIYRTDPRRAYIAVKYMRDMFTNLKEVHRVLKPGAAYVVVVGNNLIRGVEFETWRYLREHAPALGYRTDCCFTSAIINHFIKVPRKERINDDHVLVLRK